MIDFVCTTAPPNYISEQIAAPSDFVFGLSWTQTCACRPLQCRAQSVCLLFSCMGGYVHRCCCFSATQLFCSTCGEWMMLIGATAAEAEYLCSLRRHGERNEEAEVGSERCGCCRGEPRDTDRRESPLALLQGGPARRRVRVRPVSRIPPGEVDGHGMGSVTGDVESGIGFAVARSPTAPHACVRPCRSTSHSASLRGSGAPCRLASDAVLFVCCK